MVDTGTTHQGPQAGERNRRSPVKRFFSLLGPGLVTGASDDDPSGIATYAQAGASFRYGMLWAVLLTFPLMAATQMICDRMAQATGDSFGKLIRRRFSRGLRWVIGSLLAALIVANVVNLAADLMAIGQGMQLLHLGPAALWSGLAGAGILLAVVFGSFEQIGRIFKWLCLVLLVYVGVVVVANVNWHDVLRGFLGLNIRLTPAYLGLTVAVLGTTISPYMFFWQSADRIEQLRAEDLGGSHAPSLAERAPRARRRARRNSRIDVVAGMALSNLIMFSIIVATAATLGQNDQQVTSAADAAKALTPIAGQWSTVLFAVGFIGSGILAVPVLAASGAAGMAGLPVVLRADRGRHRRRDPAERRRAEPDPAPGPQRRRQRHRRGPVPAGHDGDLERPQDHGRVHEQPRLRRPRLGDDRHHVRRGRLRRLVRAGRRLSRRRCRAPVSATRALGGAGRPRQARR
jgi:NRAMP (natural resistance-associated macrophage protein)-like metal ion transporter